MLMSEIRALVEVLSSPSTITVATFGIAVTVLAFRLWMRIEKNLTEFGYKLDRAVADMDSKALIARYDMDEIRASLTEMNEKVGKDKERLDQQDEMLYRIGQGVVELGANGEVKKCFERLAAAGRWK